MRDENGELVTNPAADLIMDILLLVFLVSVIAFGFVAGLKLAGLI